MQKKQFENNNFVLYSPDSLNYITNDLEFMLNKSFELYKKIFNVDEFRKIQINYFDNISDFRNYIYELRGENKSLPEYAKGTFDNGMINAFIQPNIIEGTPLFNSRKYMASHELFHIMYQELVWEKNNQERIVWFDEGMAQFFSGECDENMTNNFMNWYDKVKSSTKIIPNLNELTHGNKFETDEYSGYKLSLLAVKYLFDKFGIDEFKKILNDYEKIMNYGENIIENAFQFYDKMRYHDNDLNQPKYLFHGSPKLLDMIEQRQAHDSNGNVENEDFAVFLTSSFIIASAYAFKNKIKEISDGLDWNFEIGYDADSEEINIIFENVNIDDDMEGYIYVFPFDEKYEHHGRSIQYKCHENIIPIDVIKIKFADFKKYYLINNEKTYRVNK